MEYTTQWKDFKDGNWKKAVDVRDFIISNYTPYLGDESFLCEPTQATQLLWQKAKDLINTERKKGVLDAETKTPSFITAYEPAYLDKELEVIVGFQTNAPLKRAIMPFGGCTLVENALEGYGYKLDKDVSHIFQKYRKSYTQAVFEVYSEEMKKARDSGILAGLPDNYGRGRIIGDYRRVALYGTNFLIEDKKNQKNKMSQDMNEHTIRLREELSDQLLALHELTQMAKSHGFDISIPAKNAKEAIQWTYFGFLAAIKQQDGAAMSLGRISTFLDIYIERDLQNGTITEIMAQEYIDQFAIKLRLVRFLRTQEYNALFSGDPTWITETIAGQGIDNRPLVTKTSFRFLHTLYNLGSAPEPNFTILWSVHLPQPFKDYCAKVSIDTSAIQYENDDLMRKYWGDDYAVACSVSAMVVGKQMQFFGARANLAKALLYAINGGVDELTGEQITPPFEPLKGDYLDYYNVLQHYEHITDWLAEIYIKTLNVIHYMHDKYNYESLQMALHDGDVLRTQATGIAGLSVVVDSLSAIKHAMVRVIRNEQGIAIDYEVEGQFPVFGDNDEETNEIAEKIVKDFMKKLNSHKTYRDAKATMSILTITSNVVYGQKTGATPCGRKAHEPFAPGATPMYGRNSRGVMAALASVAKLPYEHSQDGISLTLSLEPNALGENLQSKTKNLTGVLDGYFFDMGQHININIIEKQTLLHAMENPHLYPQLTVRIGGYAVYFVNLTKEQQLDVINYIIEEKI